jgi:hypothetical protein
MVPSAGTLCQLLALGLLVETRLELAAQQQSDNTARRALDGVSFVTEAQAEAIVADHVEAALTKMRGELDPQRPISSSGRSVRPSQHDLRRSIRHCRICCRSRRCLVGSTHDVRIDLRSMHACMCRVQCRGI